MKNIYTVTIGISAYNEERNIGKLLRSILSQKENGFRMEKIIVYCDGCMDHTEKIVRDIKKNDSRIVTIIDGKRLGKIERLQQLFQRNTSDIIMCFDADIVLHDDKVIADMISRFDHNTVVFVSMNAVPAKERSLVEKLINTWDDLWNHAVEDVHDGNNVYNVHGIGFALKKEFAKSVRFPEGLSSYARVLYFMTRQRHREFRFAKNAIGIYRSPATFMEFIKRLRRTPNQTGRLRDVFGDLVDREYSPIPLSCKIKAVLYSLLHQPLYTPLAALFIFIAYKYPYKRNLLNPKGFWDPLPSTKAVI